MDFDDDFNNVAQTLQIPMFQLIFGLHEAPLNLQIVSFQQEK